MKPLQRGRTLSAFASVGTFRECYFTIFVIGVSISSYVLTSKHYLDDNGFIFTVTFTYTYLRQYFLLSQAYHLNSSLTNTQCRPSAPNHAGARRNRSSYFVKAEYTVASEDGKVKLGSRQLLVAFQAFSPHENLAGL